MPSIAEILAARRAAPLPLHIFLDLFAANKRALCLNYMEGARLIYNWLFKGAAIPEVPFKTPDYLGNYELLELAKIIAPDPSLDSLNKAYNAIVYHMILKAINHVPRHQS